MTPAWWAVAVAAVVLVATTVMAAPGGLVGGEEPVFVALNDLPQPFALALGTVVHLGSSVGALVLATAAALARKRRVAVAAFLAWGLARLASTLLKAWVSRGRPPLLLDDVVLLQHLPADGGYPSAHSAIAAALAVVGGWGWPILRVPLALLAVAIGVARVHLGVHLPLDLVGGWSIGVLAGLAAIAVVSPRVPAPPEPAPWARRARRPAPEG